MRIPLDDLVEIVRVRCVAAAFALASGDVARGHAHLLLSVKALTAVQTAESVWPPPEDAFFRPTPGRVLNRQC